MALKKSFFNPTLCDISISILDTKAAVETVSNVVGRIWARKELKTTYLLKSMEQFQRLRP